MSPSSQKDNLIGNRFPSKTPRVPMLNINPNTLDFASTRISRYTPERYRQNVPEPISTNIRKFDSVGF
jgi:hypothetical protein